MSGAVRAEITHVIFDLDGLLLGKDISSSSVLYDHYNYIIDGLLLCI